MKSTKKAPSTLAKQKVYIENLSPEARKRYIDKIACIGGVDPYDIARKDCSESIEQLPPTEKTDIFAYCVNGKSGYSLEQFKNFRSLEAYRFFVAGFVSDVLTYSPPGSTMILVTSKVRHSQRMNDPPLRPWVILQETGPVESAHCTCMAGLGETCSHVAATLFWVAYATQLREKRTVTGEKAYWKMPTATGNITYAELKDINLQSAKSKKKTADALLQGETPPSNRFRPAKLPDYNKSSTPAHQRVDMFAAKLVQGGQRPAFTTSMKQYKYLYQAPPPPPSQVPASLRALRDMKTDKMNFKEIVDHCKDTVLPNIKVSKEEVVFAEAETRGQSDSTLWYALRAGRITASKFFDAVHTKPSSPSMSLLKSVCFPEQTIFSSVQTTWGIENEARAQEEYLKRKEKDHVDLMCSQSGLRLNIELPYLGASPDGTVTCSCHPEKGCLEIKCPFKHATSLSIEEACTDPDFCLEVIGGKPSLKKKHRYYAQIQCQLHVTGFDYCDFVVFIPTDVHIERVLPDGKFWEDNLPKAEHFFLTAVLPELVASFFTKPTGSQTPLSPQKGNKAAALSSDSDSDPNITWCYCQKHTGGTLIACDNENCKIGWFHLTCLRMKSPPRGSWFCPDCRKTKSGSTKSQRTKSKSNRCKQAE